VNTSDKHSSLLTITFVKKFYSTGPWFAIHRISYEPYEVFLVKVPEVISSTRETAKNK
jgi:hypothetical protein